MKKIIAFTILLFLNLGFAQGMRVPEYLRKLTNEAFKNYPKVREMEGLLELGKIKVELNAAGYLPTAKIDASYMRLDPVSKISIPMGASVKEFAVMPDNNYSAMLNVVQPLLDFKTSAGVDKAKSELAVSAGNLENFRTQLAYQTAQVYFGIVYLNKSLLVQQMQLDLLKSNLRQIEYKLKSGDALKYDLLTTQVRYTNVENVYTELQNQLSKQYNLLNMLSGNAGKEYIIETEINYDSFNIAGDSILAEAGRNNQDLKIARDKITSGQWDVTIAERSMLPTLNLMASAGYKNGYSPSLDDVKFNYSAGVGLSIPILSPSRPSIQKEMAAVSLEISKNALLSQQLTLSRDILNATDDIGKNGKRLLNVDKLVEQARLALELAAERYKGGVITNLELLTAQTNLQDAMLNKLQVEYSLLLSKLELSRLSGRRWW